MEVYTIVISGIALAFSIFTFWFYGRKINKQTEFINNYKIQKIQDEKVDLKKARIEVSYYHESGGNATIQVYNNGKATAKSLEILLPDIDGVFPRPFPSSFDLKPSQSIKIQILLAEGHQKSATITFKWSDEFSDNNIDNQEIQLS